MKMTVRNAEESTENEKDLQAWCLLEKSENEQWQEVISKQTKKKVKKVSQASLFSVENNRNSNPKKIVEVKDKWVKVRVTMDHVSFLMAQLLRGHGGPRTSGWAGFGAAWRSSDGTESGPGGVATTVWT